MSDKYSLQLVRNEVPEKVLPLPNRDEMLSFAMEFEQMLILYENAIKTVELRLDIMDSENHLHGDHELIHSYSSRIKEPTSIHGKMVRLGKPMTLESLQENLNDIAGVRVIVSYLEDVYAVRDLLLKDGYLTLLNEKDYIKKPKPNGYRSLHLIVAVPVPQKDEIAEMKVEIQIRTTAMDTWASLEHQLRYKKDIPEDVDIDHDLERCALMAYETDIRMQNLLTRLTKGNAAKPASAPRQERIEEIQE